MEQYRSTPQSLRASASKMADRRVRTDPPNRRSIARLVAFTKILENQCHVDDVASWLEMPLVEGFNIDAFELLLADRRDLVDEVAARRMDPSAALNNFLPDWRQVLAPQLDILVSDDGVVAVRPKN